jgi:drug/metabolite transporter (DMT)-like permease
VDLLSYAFWDAAMRHGNQVLAAAASFLTPILSSACIALVLGVSPGWRFWVAALLAVGGAAVCRISVGEGAPAVRPVGRVVPESRRGV